MTTDTNPNPNPDPGYKSIKHIRVKFKQHSKSIYSNAHIKLNNLYSHSLPEIDTLFTSEARLEVDKQCIKLIRNKIIATLTEYVHEAGQQITDIPRRITNLPLSLKTGDEYAPLH